MSGFGADWLALRAPYDAAARGNAAALATAFAVAAGDDAVVLDLAAGTGNNVRFLAPTLGNRVSWVLVDHDPGLLAMADTLGDRRQADLATDDLNGLVSEVAGVTTAALLDLVSRRWLARLVAALAGRPLLAALSVDGRYGWTPGDADDEPVMDGFFADLRGNKGFGGVALGAAAPATLSRLCAEAGYRVEMAATDWVIQRDGADMLAAMVDGIAAAAQAQGVAAAATWRQRRSETLESVGLELMLGHQDVLAVM